VHEIFVKCLGLIHFCLVLLNTWADAYVLHLRTFLLHFDLCVLLLCYVAFSLRNSFEIYQPILHYKMDCTQGICNLVSFCDSLSVVLPLKKVAIRYMYLKWFALKFNFVQRWASN